MCLNEFSNAMLRRKIDPVWKQIQYVQSCVKTKKAIHTSFRHYFVYEKEKDNSLFARAIKEVKILNGEILRVSEDYIAPAEEQKFEESLKASNVKEYCMYILMKIYHFLEVIYGVKILKMGADFITDDSDNVWLINISRVHYIQTEVLVKDEVPLKHGEGIFAYENKDSYTEEIEERYKDIEKKGTIKLLNNIMKQYYEHVRRIVGLDIPEAYYDERITDEMFAKIHPNAPFKLSEILRSSLNYDEIKTFIMNNARKLLFPHSNATQDASLKYSYSGPVPKPLPGVFITKKHENSNSNKKPTASGGDTERSASSCKMKSKKVINKVHRGVKSVFSNCIINTWWNVQPNVRDLYANFNPGTINNSETSFQRLKVSRRTLSQLAIPALNLLEQKRNEEDQIPSKILLSNRDYTNYKAGEASPELKTKKTLKGVESKPAVRIRHLGKSRSISNVHVRGV